MRAGRRRSTRLRARAPSVSWLSYLLGFSRAAVEAVFDLFDTGAMKVLPVDRADLPRVRELMTKYSDVPMDFADACLVRVAERESVICVFTVDRHGTNDLKGSAFPIPRCGQSCEAH